MFNHVFQTLLYEIAVRSLRRVCLNERPGVIGVVLQTDELAGTMLVHWGVSDGAPVQSWVKTWDLGYVEQEEKEEPILKLSRSLCLVNWPHAVNGEYNPACCRFPKSCSIPDPPKEE